jgi:hypothetical protein
MSDIILRDSRGVLLRYTDPSVLHAHIAEQRPQVSDRRRISLLKAERELLTLRIIADHLDLSNSALTRISDALEVIRVALEVKRRDYGMAFAVAEEAA